MCVSFEEILFFLVVQHLARPLYDCTTSDDFVSSIDAMIDGSSSTKVSIEELFPSSSLFLCKFFEDRCKMFACSLESYLKIYP